MKRHAANRTGNPFQFTITPPLLECVKKYVGVRRKVVFTGCRTGGRTAKTTGAINPASPTPRGGDCVATLNRVGRGPSGLRMRCVLRNSLLERANQGDKGNETQFQIVADRDRQAAGCMKPSLFNESVAMCRQFLWSVKLSDKGLQ